MSSSRTMKNSAASSPTPWIESWGPLPKCLGLRAVRSCLTKHDNNGVTPALKLNFGAVRVVNELAPLLPALTDLRALTLYGGESMNQIDLPPAPGWVALVGTACSTLKQLNSIEVRLTYSVDVSVTSALTAFSAVTALTQLRIAFHSHQSAAVARGVGAALLPLPALRELAMSQYGMRADDPIAGQSDACRRLRGMAAGIARSTKLLQISLYGCSMALEEASELGAAMRGLPELSMLDLGGLSVTPEQAFESWEGFSSAASGGKRTLLQDIGECTRLTRLWLTNMPQDAVCRRGRSAA